MTRVDFAVPRKADVRLSILDAQGRLMAVLAKGTHGAGRYQVTWAGETEDGRRAPVGIYFVRLQTPDQDFIKRVSLVR